jgi:hypothetical protein
MEREDKSEANESTAGYSRTEALDPKLVQLRKAILEYKSKYPENHRYSEELKLQMVSALGEGFSLKEVSEVGEISGDCLRRWKKLAALSVRELKIEEEENHSHSSAHIKLSNNIRIEFPLEDLSIRLINRLLGGGGG